MAMIPKCLRIDCRGSDG